MDIKTKLYVTKIFDNTLTVIRKITLILNKPAYDGMCKLDLSKVLMSEFDYDYIRNEYGNKLRLLFTDTESLIYECKTEEVCEDFSKGKKICDFSNYSTKSKSHNYSNKLAVGKIKDGTAGVQIKKFVGLKQKNVFILDRYSREYKNQKM